MRLRKEQLERREFYQMPKWLYEIKGLKSIDREIYMLGYNNWRLSEKNNWINERGEIYFELSIQKLMDRTNETKRSIIASLKTLVDAGIFEVEKLAGKPTKFFLVELTDRAHSIEVSRKLTEKQRKVTGYEIVPSSEIVTSVESATGSSVEIVPTNQVRNRTPSNNDLSKNKVNKNNHVEDRDFFDKLFEEISGGELRYHTTNQEAVKKLFKTMSKDQVAEYIITNYESLKNNGQVNNINAVFTELLVNGKRQINQTTKKEVVQKTEIAEEPKMNPKFDTKGPNFIDTTDPKVISEYFENKETLEISSEEEEKALNILRVQGSINHILAMKNNKKLYINTLRQVLAGA